MNHGYSENGAIFHTVLPQRPSVANMRGYGGSCVKILKNRTSDRSSNPFYIHSYKQVDKHCMKWMLILGLFRQISDIGKAL